MNKKIEFLMERLGKSEYYFEKMSEGEIIKLWLQEKENATNERVEKLTTYGGGCWDTVNTLHLQVASVVKFMHHIGFEPEYQAGKLMRFVRYRLNEFKRYSGADDIVSVRMAISLHNGYPVYPFTADSSKPVNIINEYLSQIPIKISPYDYGVAKASKIVEKAKLQFSRKKGVIVQSHKVKFASVYAQATYGHFVEEKE